MNALLTWLMTAGAMVAQQQTKAPSPEKSDEQRNRN
jgi:hypothetical protein